MARSLSKFRTPDGKPYFLSINPKEDVFQASAAADGLFDSVARLLWGLVEAGNTFLDLGGNIGTIAVPLAVKGAVVHAFEILENNVQALEVGARETGVNVHIHACAALDYDGVTSIGGTSAWGRIVADSSIKVPCIRIDTFLKDAAITKVDAIKIDIEGSEIQALVGMVDCLQRDAPDIVIESNVYCTDGGRFSVREIFSFLSKRGYSLYRIGDATLHPFAVNGLQEVIYCDYLATKRSPKDLVERTGFSVQAMSRDQIINSILLQDQMPDVHKIYTFGAVLEAPFLVRFNLRVMRARQKWKPLTLESAETAIALRLGARKI